MKRRTKIAIGVLIGLAVIVLALRLSIVSIRIELPPAEPVPAPPVHIQISDTGQLTVDGAPSNLETLPRDIAAHSHAASPAEQRIMMHAGQGVRYDTFMAVVNRLKDSGWIKVGLINEDIHGPDAP